ncbi:MAG TPA: hypothetical protein DGB85_03550 [Deltaproteobacteria bacterium]|nr:hypothetical protein [Deltaproteobacteria bacterium]
MRRLSQGMVNHPKVKTPERMMPKVQLLLFSDKLWLESISFICRMLKFLTNRWHSGSAACPIEEP